MYLSWHPVFILWLDACGLILLKLTAACVALQQKLFMCFLINHSHNLEDSIIQQDALDNVAQRQLQRLYLIRFIILNTICKLGVEKQILSSQLRCCCKIIWVWSWGIILCSKETVLSP